MSLADFLFPVESNSFQTAPPNCLIDYSYAHAKQFPSLDGFQIAIIGVEEDRQALNNQGCALAANAVRKYLYNLHKGTSFPAIVDLGNIKQGATVSDSYTALSITISELIKQRIVPVVIGGSHDLTYAQYLSYVLLDHTVDVVIVDPKFDINESEDDINAQSFLYKIILHKPNYLFNLSLLGYQTYFVDQKSIEIIEKLKFDAHRLGKLKEKLEEVEPLVRTADMLSFDISAIRHSDAAANAYSSPNGFYGEDACQIARYAGMSDNLTSIGFYEMNPKLDVQNQSAMLMSQMIWYFADGYANRKNDLPLSDKSNFIKYTTSLKNNQYQLVYYKSKKSNRWWMEVPISSQNSKYEKHHLIPCSYHDYETACNDELPDRWWQAYQKFC